MKKSSKFISVILVLVMLISVIPISASGRAIDTSKYNSIESVISHDGLYSLAEYIVNNLNTVSDDTIGSVLRLFYIFANDEDINSLIGKKDITELSNADTAKILVNWLDTYILPDLNKSLEEEDVIRIINNAVPGLSIKVGSVQEIFNTLAQLSNPLLAIPLLALGDIRNLNVSAVRNVTVKNNELNAVKKLFTFLKDNLSVIKKAINGTLTLGIIDDYVKEYIEPIGKIDQLLKSYIYKLIDPDAQAGEYDINNLGGDWAKSRYSTFTADQLLAAALIKNINNNDDFVSASAANEALNLSFYGILSKYAPVIYKNFAVDFLNENLQEFVDKLNDVSPDLRAMFKATMPTFDENTFADILKNVSSEGFIGQFNNIIVKIAELVLTSGTYNSLGLAKGNNSNLNSNITKICRFALPILFEVEDQLEVTFPDILKTNYKTMTLSEIAVYILKPFYSTWFTNSSTAAVNSADSLADLAVLAMYYAATNPELLEISYNFNSIKNEIFASDGKMKNLSDDACTQLVLKTVVGIGIGYLQQNADELHFNIKVDNSNWENAVNQISNWVLDFAKGLPSVVDKHDLRNQNNYGPFYKLNVLLNELFNFSFLNGVGDITFKLDINTVLTDAFLGNLYNFNIEAMIAVFEKNNNKDNILEGKFIPSVLGIVDRIVTALFEHDCVRNTKSVTTPGSDDAHTVTTTYTYCTVCGAYFSKTVKENTVKEEINFSLGDVDNDGAITAADARLALRRAVNLETYAEGSAMFLASDVDKDGEITASDARVILRIAVGIEKISSYNK